MNAIRRNPEYAKWLPAFTSEQRAGLEAEIKADGKVSDPIIVWKETGEVVDGMHRHEIAEKLGIGWRPEYRSFGSVEEANAWAIRHARNRRNLSQSQWAMLGERLAELEAIPAQARQEASRAQPGQKIGDAPKVGATLRPPTKPEEKGKSTEKAAAAVGVSPRMMQQARAVAAKGTPALQEAVKEGKLPVGEAAKATAKPAPEQDKLAADALAGKKPPRKPKPEVAVGDRQTCPRCKGKGWVVKLAPGQREADPIWDGWCAVFGIDPVTDKEKKRIGAHVRDLKLKKATPEQIKSLYVKHGVTWPGIKCTPDSLLKHWDELGAETSKPDSLTPEFIAKAFKGEV